MYFGVKSNTREYNHVETIRSQSLFQSLMSDDMSYPSKTIGRLY